MWDLNRSERKALGTALLLVGTGLLGRVLLAPDPGRLDWRPAGDPSRDLDGVHGDVVSALLLEQRAQTPLRRGERIDLNDAPAEELRRLPGVGPGLAEAIILERRISPFRGVTDLTRVGGIGDVTARRLAPYVEFGGATESGAGGTLARPSAAGSACSGAADRIDINRASRSELEGLPGVGPVIAGRIVEDRSVAGPFEATSALRRVRGIGERSLAALEGRVCAGTP